MDEDMREKTRQPTLASKTGGVALHAGILSHLGNTTQQLKGGRIVSTTSRVKLANRDASTLAVYKSANVLVAVSFNRQRLLWRLYIRISQPSHRMSVYRLR